MSKLSTTMNRLWNITNPYQGKYKKVLCVCSAGLLRSPTAAHVLSQEPYSFNTRAAGIIADYALIPVDSVLLEWADEIVCMEEDHATKVSLMYSANNLEKKIKVITLGIEDGYGFRDPELMELIKSSYNKPNSVYILEKAK